jgi:phage-related protein
MLETEKPLFWIGSSNKDLLALPVEVKRRYGSYLG